MSVRSALDPLRQFCTSVPRTVISPDLESVVIPTMGGGRGIVATKRIPAGKKIVSLPSALMLTAKVARAYLAGLPSPQPPQSSVPLLSVKKLTAVEAIASFLVLCQHDVSNPFHQWVIALPRRYDNLIELPPESVSHCVWSPRFQAKVLLEQQTFRQAFKRALEAVPALQSLPPSADIYEEPYRASATDGRNLPSSDESVFAPATERKFLWAYNSLMSRGFSFDEEIWCMMPWVDYFNFSLQPNVSMGFNDKTSCYEFTTSRAVEVGGQCFLRYGQYSDFELLMWYGFTLRPVLFPNFTAGRITKSEEVGLISPNSKNFIPPPKQQLRGSVQDEEIPEEEVANLQIVYAYCFSPTSDPNGDHPIGVQWAVDLAAGCGLTVPATWRLDPGIHDARIGYCKVSDGMKHLIHMYQTWNPEFTHEDILRKIVQLELSTLTKSLPPLLEAPAGSAEASMWDRTVASEGAWFEGLSTPVERMAMRMSIDHWHLLSAFCALQVHTMAALISPRDDS